jgi:hypothetical protein
MLPFVSLLTVMQTLRAHPPKHELPFNAANLIPLAAVAARPCHQLSSRAPIRGKQTGSMAVTKRFLAGAAGEKIAGSAGTTGARP